MSDVRIGLADIVTAFSERTIGTKVLNAPAFMDLLRGAVAIHPFPENGQAVISLPISASAFLSPGVTLADGLSEEDFVVRKYRGRFSAYVRRDRAPKVQIQNVSAVVYTLEAYRVDPDVVLPEYAKLAEVGVTHVLVAILASVEETHAYGSWVLLHNMAGGNNSFIPKTTAAQAAEWTSPLDPPDGASTDLQMLHRWVALAKQTQAHSGTYLPVAD
jgi:hypothetical protein